MFGLKATKLQNIIQARDTLLTIGNDKKATNQKCLMINSFQQLFRRRYTRVVSLFC